MREKHLPVVAVPVFPVSPLYKEGAGLAAELLQWVEDNTPADIKAKYSMPLSTMIEEVS